MPYSPATYEEKPYNRCIDCRYIGKRCDGPDFLAMEIPRLCEWARLRKAYLTSQDKKWTNNYIAEQADISRATADRFFAGDIDDLKFTTASRILKVLVNGTWGQYPCALAAEASDDKSLAMECTHLKELLNEEKAKTKFLKEQVEFKEQQMRHKDGVMNARGDFATKQAKDIRILSVLLGLCVVIIIGSLIVDLLNPSVGYFWLR